MRWSPQFAAAAVVAVVLSVSACGSSDKPTTAGATRHPEATTVSSAATTASSAAPAQPNSADPFCPLSADDIRTAIRPVFPGPVVPDNPPGAVECSYQVDTQRWIHIRTAPYTANRMGGLMLNGKEFRWGGSSAQQVFESSVQAYQGIAQAGGGKYKFEQYPDIGAGLVTNGVGGFVLAGKKDVWYQGNFGIFTDPGYNVVAMNVAKALAAR